MFKHFVHVLFLTALLATPVSADVPLADELFLSVELPKLSDEGSVRLADLKGKVVYVDFWASWCAPCRLSLPELDKLRAKYREEFEVFAVNLDESAGDARAFLDKYPVSYPVVSDRKAVYPPKFGVKGMPTSYIFDRNGKLRYVHEGYRKGDASKIEAVVRELIAE